MSQVRRELRQLVRLSTPVVLAQIGSMLLGVVDMVMVGHLDVDALAAASMANAYLFAVLLFGQGLVQGIDPLIAQAHGAGRGELAGLAAQRGAVIALVVSVPLAGLVLGARHFLAAAGQPEALIEAAHAYAVIQIPSIPCFLLFVTARQYLLGREIVRPAMWITLGANLFNVAANYLLIFGAGSWPGLGLLGAGLATSLTRLGLIVGLVAWILRFRLHAGAWTPWSRESVSPAALRRVLAIGVPVALQMSLESWAFSAATLIAGRLGPVSLAAHTVTLNLAALAFMVPLGISQGTVTRVGNLLGAGRGEDARRAAWVAFGLGGGVMSVSATLFVVLRETLPTIFTPDAAVVALGATILPVAAAFQVFDGLQVVGCGVLRGMGETRPAALFNLLAYWVIGIPLGAFWALQRGLGLPGLWWALCIGLGIVAGGVLLRVRWRGPEQVQALVR